MPPLNIESSIELKSDDFLGAAGTAEQYSNAPSTDAKPPQPATGPSAEDGEGTAFSKATRSVLLESIGVSATTMPPVAGAGVALAQFVLGIAAGSIVLLGIYLIYMDVVVARDVRSEYQEVLNPSRIGSEFYTLGRLEQLSVDFTAARNKPEWQMPAESRQNADGVLKLIAALPSVTSTQKTQLNDCVPPPAANQSRNEKLDGCIAVLEGIRQAALAAASGSSSAQIAGEAASKINEHRQSLHTFWIQAAQLILLNLLLPLLTALFGYVFGTQQAQKSN
jgi:hypothetical protein